MGNSSQKVVSIEGIKVRQKSNNSEISLKISDNFKYPPKPSDAEIKKQMELLLETLVLTTSQAEELATLSLENKWKLICRHKEFLSKNHEEIKHNINVYNEIEDLVSKLKANPNKTELKNLRKWIKSSSLSQRNKFYLFEGLSSIVNMLEVAEVCSRNTKNYSTQIGLLRVLEEIVKHKDGISELIRVPNSLSIILFNFNVLHVEITTVVMEILCNLMWSSEIIYMHILDAANKMKKEKNYLSRFQPFCEIFNESLNIILIENVLAFLDIVLTSAVNRHACNLIKSELIAFGVKNALEKVKGKIADNHYKIEDCTFETVLKSLRAVKAQSNESSSTNKIILTELQGTEQDLNNYRNSILLRAQQGGRSIDVGALRSFREEMKEANQKETSEDIENNAGLTESIASSSNLNLHKGDESNDSAGKTAANKKWKKFSVYLEASNKAEFEQHVECVLNLIESFEKLLEEEAFDENEDLNLQIPEEHLPEFKTVQSVTNVDIMFNQAKENAFQNDAFEDFLGLLQKIQLIPVSERGKEIWKALDKSLSKMLGGDAEAPGPLFFRNISKIFDEQRGISDLEARIFTLEDTLKAREAEIKKISEEKIKFSEQVQPLIRILKEKRYQNMINENEKKFQTLLVEKDHMNNLLASKEREIYDLRDQVEKLRIQIVEKPDTICGGDGDKLKSPIENKEAQEGKSQADGNNLGNLDFSTIPGAPNLGIPGAPNLGIPGAPNLGIPGAPNLGIPGAPNLGIPGAPSLGIPGAPALGIPGAPNLGIPGAPNLGIPGAPNLGIPGAPSLGIPGAPSLGIPGAPSLGIPGAPSLFTQAPTQGLPNIGVPGAPLMGLSLPPNLFSGMGQGPAPVQKTKKKHKPRIPLKGAMWTIVRPNEISNTIWDKINDEILKLDYDEIENLFSRKESSVPVRPVSVQMTSSVIRIEKTKIIEGNRSKNVALILGKLRLSNTSLVNALYECDERVLTLSNLESLINAIPTELELQEVKDSEGDKSNLDDPEQFFIEIGAVKGYSSRLSALRFQRICHELIEELQNKLDAIKRAFESVKFDSKLGKILEGILGVGNYLNGTGPRGGAFGFKLEFIEKLTDVKGCVPKINLLSYTLEFIEKGAEKEVIAIKDAEMKDFDVASKNPLSQLSSDLNEIRKGLRATQSALKSQTEIVNDRITKQVGAFEAETVKTVEALEKKLEDTNQSYLSACSFLLEDPKESSEKLGYRLLVFWNQVRTVKRDIELQKQKASSSQARVKSPAGKLDGAGKISNVVNTIGLAKSGFVKPVEDHKTPVKEVKVETLEEPARFLSQLKHQKSQEIVASLKLMRAEKQSQFNMDLSDTASKEESNEKDVEQLQRLLVQGILKKSKRFFKKKSS